MYWFLLGLAALYTWRTTKTLITLVRFAGREDVNEDVLTLLPGATAGSLVINIGIIIGLVLIACEVWR